MLAIFVRFARRIVFAPALRNHTTGHGLLSRFIAAALAYIMVITALPPLPAHAQIGTGLPFGLAGQLPSLAASLPPAGASSASTAPLLRSVATRSLAPMMFADYFGPQIYTRSSGAPVTVTSSFTLPAGAHAPFVMCVTNGADDGSARVSSAWVKLNGQDVFRARDFNVDTSTAHSVTLPRLNS